MSQFSLYLGIFAGILVGGESVFIPAVYLTFRNVIDPIPLILISASAGIISDSIWYWVGKTFPVHRLLEMKSLKRSREYIAHASSFFDRNSLKLLYLSKFVYGTRTAMQVICGQKRIPFGKYLIVNTLGILSWLLLLYGIAYALRQQLSHYEETVQNIELVFAVSFLIIMILLICFTRFYGKRWFQ